MENVELSRCSEIRGRTKAEKWDKAARKGNEKKRIANLYDVNGEYRKAERMRFCGSVAERVVCPGDLEHYMEVEYKTRCHLRMCPVCAEKTAGYHAGQLVEAINHIYADGHDHFWVMLVLTVRNCRVDDLKSTVDMMLKGWGRMIKRNWWREYVKGSVRRMEITYNRETKEFHPHIHVLMEVDKTYFQTTTKKFTTGYKTTDEWAEYWRTAIKANYKPVVYIKRVARADEKISEKWNRKMERDDRELKMIEGAALETVAKYTVKYGSVLKGVPLADQARVVEALDEALGNRRVVAYLGTIDKARKELNHAEPELMEDEPIHDVNCPVCGLRLKRQVYKWDGGGYEKQYERELRVPERLSDTG